MSDVFPPWLNGVFVRRFTLSARGNDIVAGWAITAAADLVVMNAMSVC